MTDRLAGDMSIKNVSTEADMARNEIRVSTAMLCPAHCGGPGLRITQGGQYFCPSCGAHGEVMAFDPPPEGEDTIAAKPVEEIHAFDRPRCDVHGTALERVTVRPKMSDAAREIHGQRVIVSWRCAICDLEASEGDAGGSESRDSYGHEHATERRVPPASAERGALIEAVIRATYGLPDSGETWCAAAVDAVLANPAVVFSALGYIERTTTEALDHQGDVWQRKES